MGIKENDYFPLAAGPVTLGIKFDVPENKDVFAGYFTGYAGTGGIDLYLDFTIVGHTDLPDIPVSLVQAKRWRGDEFVIGDDLFSGRFDQQHRRWNVKVKNIMTKGQMTRVFEQFLYQAFFSACGQARKEAILLHSSGVSVGSRGFLFVGASGMGKSTVAELSKEYGVINDEINILSPDPEGFRLHRSPFNSYFSPKNGAAAPLKAVFLLAHADSCRLERVSPAQAVAEITGQVVPPLGLEHPFSPAVANRMMAAALTLANTVPVYRLHFPVQGGFWPLILELFPQ